MIIERKEQKHTKQVKTTFQNPPCNLALIPSLSPEHSKIWTDISFTYIFLQSEKVLLFFNFSFVSLSESSI